MAHRSKLLLILLLLAGVWQAFGALGYMTILAHSPLAPIIYGGVKGCMVLLPILALWLGWKPGGFLRGCKQKDALAGILLGLVFFFGIIGFFFFFPTLFESAAAEALPRATTFGIGTPAIFLLVGILFSVLHSLFEEFYWRWFVFGGLHSYVPTRLAALFAGLAFSLHHIIILLPFLSPPLAILGGLMVGTVGGIWCLLYAAQKNLLASWISHTFADLAIICVIYHILFL